MIKVIECGYGWPCRSCGEPAVYHVIINDLRFVQPDREAFCKKCMKSLKSELDKTLKAYEVVSKKHRKSLDKL